MHQYALSAGQQAGARAFGLRGRPTRSMSRTGTWRSTKRRTFLRVVETAPSCQCVRGLPRQSWRREPRAEEVVRGV